MANTYKGYGLTPQGNAVPYSGGSAPASVLEAENAQKLGGVPAGDYALKTDTVANSEMLGDKAPQYYLPAVNLLINSDFSNGRFIVQAGLNGLHGSTVYLGDRWIGDQRITAEQKQDHIVLTSTAHFAYIVQKVHVERGKTYTLAIKSTGADCYLGFDVNGAKERHHEDDVYTLQVDVPYDSNLIEVRLYPAFKDGGGTANIYWAALYEGGYTTKTLPPYVPTHPRIENLKLGNPVQPVNLLDNPDCAIAQAGYPVWDSSNQKWTSGLHGTELYAADRWICSFSDSIFSRNGNVNHFETKSDSYAFISQKLFGDGREKGKSYTFAITLADGTVAIATGTFPSENVTTQTTIGTVIVKVNCRLYILKETDGYVRLRIDLTQPNSFVDFLHVAFYEGIYTAETLPPFVQPDPVLEMQKCRYRYQEIVIPEWRTFALGHSFGNGQYFDAIIPVGNMAAGNATVKLPATGLYIDADAALPLSAVVNSATVYGSMMFLQLHDAQFTAGTHNISARGAETRICISRDL